MNLTTMLTNYAKKQVNHNQMVTRYRGGDEVEVDFKAMRGLLDLERVLYSRPERIDAYIFLKVIALFVLTFLRSHAEREGVKTTEKQIQESMGDLLLIKPQFCRWDGKHTPLPETLIGTDYSENCFICLNRSIGSRLWSGWRSRIWTNLTIYKV